MDEGPIKTKDNKRYGISNRGAVRVTAEPFRLDEIDIVSIDSPLTPLALRTATAADTRERLDHAIRRRSDQARQHARSALLQFLQQNGRLYRLAANLRGPLRSRARHGSHVASDVDDGTLAIYRRALAFRALAALRQLYGFYRGTVLEGNGLVVAPEARLDGPRAPGENACALLTSAVGALPHFAEAWLELGFARLDLGRMEGAHEAFARARRLPPLVPAERFDPDPRLVAAIEQARLLIVENRTTDALAALQQAPLTGPIPRGFYALRARLLLDAGRVSEALDAFDRAMQPDHIQQSFAGLLPRHLIALEAELAVITSPSLPEPDASQFLPKDDRSAAAPAATGVMQPGHHDVA
jgi:tetratricopeptide (TPR) repeat protein